MNREGGREGREGRSREGTLALDDSAAASISTGTLYTVQLYNHVIVLLVLVSFYFLNYFVPTNIQLVSSRICAKLCNQPELAVGPSNHPNFTAPSSAGSGVQDERGY